MFSKYLEMYQLSDMMQLIMMMTIALSNASNLVERSYWLMWSGIGIVIVTRLQLVNRLLPFTLYK